MLLILLSLIFLFYFLLFKERLWFFHDSIEILLNSTNFSLNYLLLPHGEHFIPLTKLVFFVQFSLFGINFTPYFVLSIFLHLANLYLLWLIVIEITKKHFFAYMAVILFAVNVTFFEIILWFVSQNLLCHFFISLAFLFWLKLRKKRNINFLLIAGLSSVGAAFSFGFGLLYPFVLAILSSIDKKTNRKNALFFSILGLVSVLIYLFFAGQNLYVINKTPLTFQSIPDIIEFLYIGLVDGLVFRFFYALFPTRFLAFNNILKPFLLIAATVFLLLIFILPSRKSKEKLIINIALIINIIYPYFMASLRRATISPGEAMAERYAYNPLFFLIIFLIYQFSLLKQRKGLKTFCCLFVLYILTTQVLVFYKRAFIWTKQTIRNKLFFQQLSEKINSNSLEKNCKLPKGIKDKQEPCERYIDLLKGRKF